jgi:hypothetical protein
MPSIVQEIDASPPEYTRILLHVPHSKVEALLFALQRDGLVWRTEPAAQHSAAYTALEASNRRERFFLAALGGCTWYHIIDEAPADPALRERLIAEMVDIAAQIAQRALASGMP